MDNCSQYCIELNFCAHTFVAGIAHLIVCEATENVNLMWLSSFSYQESNVNSSDQDYGLYTLSNASQGRL